MQETSRTKRDGGIPFLAAAHAGWIGLGTLSDELVLLVLCNLIPDPALVLRASAVCRSWYLDRSRSGLWRSLAAAAMVQLPQRGSTTRLANNTKRAVLLLMRQQLWGMRLRADRAVWGLWMKLHQRDCVADLSRRMSGLPVNHRLTFFADRTIMMLACWRGRHGAVGALLNMGADLSLCDTNGATALVMAAWAGHLRAVSYTHLTLPTKRIV
eukprot:TRINITY_DN40947_c0_g1_i1.p2 TRINITY_DN40947_c0_g1~~TRINITY_DN40947_c0_g1_i1.p2  ORF type:complete len:212 (+),score=39.12 TRINITY_DN40947_c0_g1_i1:68-703(+)